MTDFKFQRRYLKKVLNIERRYLKKQRIQNNTILKNEHYLPIEIIEMIFDFCDYSTQLDFSVISKYYYERYKKERKNIIKHFKMENDIYEQLSDELLLCLPKNRVKSIYDSDYCRRNPPDGEWRTCDQWHVKKNIIILN